MLAGDPIAVEHELCPGHERPRRTWEQSGNSSLPLLLAQAMFAEGRYEEAEEFAVEASEMGRPTDIHPCRTIGRTTRAKALARRRAPEAEKLAREAVAFIEQSDFVLLHADALMDLAEVLRRAGRPSKSPFGCMKGRAASSRPRASLDEVRQA